MAEPVEMTLVRGFDSCQVQRMLIKISEGIINIGEMLFNISQM